VGRAAVGMRAQRPQHSLQVSAQVGSAAVAGCRQNDDRPWKAQSAGLQGRAPLTEWVRDGGVLTLLNELPSWTSGGWTSGLDRRQSAWPLAGLAEANLLTML